ncbi:MAG: metallophosphoesterase [Halothiobacillus sp.]|jgi:serine/threonine protein phosphatase 1|nr:metallophosphoesterase [Halothiobacillus sp.]
MFLESRVPFFNHLPVNTRGRDFVIGDLHGMFDLLMRHLDAHSFDPSVDRVFSVGDLVDRGPDSLKCIRLTDNPWFHAIRGNHEQSITALGKAFSSSNDRSHIKHLCKGGADWVFKGNALSDAFFEALPIMESLPLIIEVGDGDGFGIAHADIIGFDSWQSLGEWFTQRGADDNWIDYVNDHTFSDESKDPVLHHLLYGRKTLKKLMRGDMPAENAHIKGIPLVFFGHTVIDLPTQFSNRIYLDTCAHEFHELSFVQACPAINSWSHSHAA